MSPNPSIDIVILTVLNEEYQAVRSRLQNIVPARTTGTLPSLFAEIIGEIGDASTGRPYIVLLAMIGRVGTSQGAVAAQHIIERWRPRYVLFVGIAGGSLLMLFMGTNTAK
jgi:nucleoside phosphorylase